MDHIRNEKIREIMKVDHDIITTIEKKRLVWSYPTNGRREVAKEGPELDPPRTTKKRETTKKLEGRNPTDDGG